MVTQSQQTLRSSSLPTEYPTVCRVSAPTAAPDELPVELLVELGLCVRHTDVYAMETLARELYALV